MTPSTLHLRQPLLRVAILALGIPAIACTESTKPADVAPFDAQMQPALTATSTVSGAAGNEVVRVVVIVTNPDGRPRWYTLRQPCLLSLRLYGTPERTGTPVYPSGFHAGGCKPIAFTDTLAAHASVTYANNEYPIVYSASAPNGQPLPPGRYFGTVSVDIAELTPAASTLPVGEVVLAAP